MQKTRAFFWADRYGGEQRELAERKANSAGCSSDWKVTEKQGRLKHSQSCDGK